jgi:protein O-mannosyl-transferase
VLSGLFFFIAIWCYSRYVEAGRWRYLIAVVAAYSLGLMAKPMAVTLPFVLLLLDFWPLGRIDLRRGGHTPWGRLLVEKLPMLMIAMASSVVTVRAMQAIISLEALPLTMRIAHAAGSYLAYVGMTVWPHNLAVYYPHPYDAVLTWGDLAACVGLILVTLFALWSASRRPYLAVGWLWYLVTLVPVIGIVQVGDHAMADRYTYVPSVGLLIAVVWSAAEATARWRLPASVQAVIAGVVLAGLSAATWFQLGRWRNTETLFIYTLAVTPENSTAHAVLGSLRLEQDRLDEATEQLQAAVRIDPGYARAHYLLAATLERRGDLEAALAHYEAAVEQEPGNQPFQFGYGLALQNAGRPERAVARYLAALDIDPDDALTHYDLGIAYEDLGKLDAAIRHFEESVRLAPTDPDAHVRLAGALRSRGDLRGAARQYARTLELDPQNGEASEGLASVQAASRQ